MEQQHSSFMFSLRLCQFLLQPIQLLLGQVKDLGSSDSNAFSARKR